MKLVVATLCFGLLTWLGLTVPQHGQAQQSAKPYVVRIVGEKEKTTERILPVDPKMRIEYQYVGNMGFGITTEGKRLCPNPGSIQTLFMVDGKVESAKVGKKLQEIPEGPARKKRYGGQTVWEQGDIRVTMTLEAVPSKPFQPKAGVPATRRLDTLLVKFTLENISSAPHKVGCRTFIDTLIVDNDGALFASPTTHPNMVLNGITLQNKGVPDFLEVLQRPNLQAPGFKGILSFKLGERLEGPGRVLLTSFGAGGKYEVPVVASKGDSACALYWEPRELPPQAKREVAFAYGQGIASTNEGRLSAEFGGSFEPGKSFTVTAYVDSPADGQYLTLHLPKGVERIDGKATQVVPPAGETGQGVVMWRCRLAQVGAYPIEIRSNNGVSQTWTVTVSAPE